MPKKERTYMIESPWGTPMKVPYDDPRAKKARKRLEKGRYHTYKKQHKPSLNLWMQTFKKTSSQTPNKPISNPSKNKFLSPGEMLTFGSKKKRGKKITFPNLWKWPGQVPDKW